MSLASGTKLGPYEILSPLGAGGMGEVYRAKDMKLHREVAIKILPADVASSPERLQGLVGLFSTQSYTSRLVSRFAQAKMLESD